MDEPNIKREKLTGTSLKHHQVVRRRVLCRHRQSSRSLMQRPSSFGVAAPASRIRTSTIVEPGWPRFRFPWVGVHSIILLAGSSGCRKQCPASPILGMLSCPIFSGYPCTEPYSRCAVLDWCWGLVSTSLCSSHRDPSGVGRWLSSIQSRRVEQTQLLRRRSWAWFHVICLSPRLFL